MSEIDGSGVEWERTPGEAWFAVESEVVAAPVVVQTMEVGRPTTRLITALEGHLGPMARTATPGAPFLDSLDAAQRRRLVAIVGERVPALATGSLDGARRAALLRHPLDLVATLYYRAKYRRDRAVGARRELVGLLAAQPLERVYEHFAGGEPGDGRVQELWASYCNAQARMLLAGHHDLPPLPFTDAAGDAGEAWRERLLDVTSQLDFVVASDAVEAVAAQIAEQPPAATKRREDADPGWELLAAGRDAAERFNWLDRELYERFIGSFKRRDRRGKAKASGGPAGGSGGGGGGNLVELLFDRQSRGEGQPVVVFQHLRKTAGTSLKRVAREELPEARYERRLSPRGATDSASLSEWYRDLLAELGPKRTKWIRFAAGHTANFLLPLLEDPVAICLLRDPVNRVISRYYFISTPRFALEDVYREWGGAPPFVRNKRQMTAGFFNGQARALLEPHVDTRALGYSRGPSPDADRWRELLSVTLDRYVVGTTERYDEALPAFSRATGLNLEPRERREKANRHRPPLREVAADLRETIREYNWLDVELHEEVTRRQAATEAETTPAAAPPASTPPTAPEPSPDDPARATD
jgi:hypothetical protein